jgi:hypothetical protein
LRFLLFGYSVDGGAVQVVDLASGEGIPSKILDVLTDDKVQKWSFKANFERVCLYPFPIGYGHIPRPVRQQPLLFAAPQPFPFPEPRSVALLHGLIDVHELAALP